MAGILDTVTHELTITNYSDWLVFVERIQMLVHSGRIRRISGLKSQRFGKTDEWYLDPETGEIYVHGVPNAPALPSWEKVDVLAELNAPDPPPLSVFKVGAITVTMAHVMKLKLEDLARSGIVEELPDTQSSKRGTEKRFRDTVSNIVYRLSEYYGLEDPDDIRWEVVSESSEGIR